MKKLFLCVLVISSSLVACGGGSNTNDPNNPDTSGGTSYPIEGTLLSTECDGYTLIEEIADGSGGSYTEETEQSPDCGWTDPVLSVELTKEQGDRFDHVSFDVSYTQNGEVLEYEYEVSAGTVVMTDTGFDVVSDGNYGTHVAVIQGEEFQYSFVEEPVCYVDRSASAYGSGTDCEGLWQGSSTDDYVYYGPDDTRMVTWSIIYVRYDPTQVWDDIYPPKEGVAPVPYEPTDFKYISSQKEIEAMNRTLQESGVYVHLDLVAVYGTSSFQAVDYRRWITAGLMPRSDFILDYNSFGGDNCGFAGMAGKFRSYAEKGWMYYLRPSSRCGADTALHEIGHTVGLGHGIYNSSQAGCGITWPAFACGQSSICEATGSDIMFYGGGNKIFSSPNRLCKDAYPKYSRWQDDNETVTGRLDFSATGYAINRVRYDVSLIHDEFAQAAQMERLPSGLEYIFTRPDVEGPIIID